MPGICQWYKETCSECPSFCGCKACTQKKTDQFPDESNVENEEQSVGDNPEEFDKDLQEQTSDIPEECGEDLQQDVCDKARQPPARLAADLMTQILEESKLIDSMLEGNAPIVEEQKSAPETQQTEVNEAPMKVAEVPLLQKSQQEAADGIRLQQEEEQRREQQRREDTEEKWKKEYTEITKVMPYADIRWLTN
jgi:hypothetical protein